MEKRPKILVVDDEETLCELLRFNLESEGYDADTALSAEEALTLRLGEYSLFLLDIMMGDISGLQLAEILKKRSDTAHIPVIFCTAKSTENDIVEGLDLGADDYITKPYSLRTLLARVRSVLRRAEAHPAPEQKHETLSYGGLSLSLADKRCTADGREVRMPRKEFEIMSLFLANPGRIFTRQELIERVWPEDVIVVDRVVDVNIRRLRAKLGDYGQHIQTRTGYGYGFIE